MILLLLYFFGKTIPPKKNPSKENVSTGTERVLDAETILKASKSRLTPAQQAYISGLETAVVRGDVKDQQAKVYRQLADFWRDSVKNAFLPMAYYMGEAAKLENSEKSLTFAAQLFLENLGAQDDPALKAWMAKESRELFEKALQLNPGNDSLKIGLGGSFIFGAGSGNPQEVMQGIQQVLEVARRDTNNMYAQFMLGLGGLESGQFDKAIERLTKVVTREPDNVEAILTLAEAYERTNNKAQAIVWYEVAKKKIANKELVNESDQRIKTLQ